MKKHLLFCSFFLLTSISLTAQVGWKCGTPPVRLPMQGLSWAKNEALAENDTATLFIPVTLNFVGKDDGSGYFSKFKAVESLCHLQTDFAPSGFHFFLENIRHINHTEFYAMPDAYNNSLEMYQFLDSNNVLNTLNLYIIQGNNSSFVVWNDTLDISVPPVMLQPQQHAVVLAKQHLTDNVHIIAHEVGHYFGLWHTFNGWENYLYSPPVPDTLPYAYYYNGVPYVWNIPVERADGSNCEHAGDWLCDTPPDYYSFLWACDGNGQSNQVLMDALGNPFKIDGTLIMSYSLDACKNRFSPGQTAWMRSVAQIPREYLLYNQTPPAPFSAPVWAMIYPPDGETVAISDSITLEWEDIPGADFVLLEFGRVVNANLYVPIVKDVFPNESAFKVRVNPQLNYYWIVKAVNRYYPCEVVADTSYFSTTLVSAHETRPADLLRLYPNPVSSRLYWRLPETAANPENISIQLFDAQSRLLQRQSLPVEQTLDLQNLSPGMYTLRVVAGERVYVGKFVKQ